MEERLKKYTSPTPTESGCILWIGYKDEQGRGYISIKHKPHRVHRVSYELHKGKILDGLVIRHTCDNTSCINPDHLITGTQADNMNDMKERNRRKGIVAVKGEKHGKSKLTDNQVTEIKRLLTEQYTYSYIASLFNVSRHTIGAINNNKVWKHIK